MQKPRNPHFISTVTPYYPQPAPDALGSSVHMETAIPLREELNGYIRQMTGCIDTSSCFEELPADLQLQYSVDGIPLQMPRAISLATGLCSPITSVLSGLLQAFKKNRELFLFS